MAMAMVHLCLARWDCAHDVIVCHRFYTPTLFIRVNCIEDRCALLLWPSLFYVIFPHLNYLFIIIIIILILVSELYMHLVQAAWWWDCFSAHCCCCWFYFCFRMCRHISIYDWMFHHFPTDKSYHSRVWACVCERGQTSLSGLKSSSRVHVPIVTYQKFIKRILLLLFSLFIVVTKIMSIHWNPFDT